MRPRYLFAARRAVRIGGAIVLLRVIEIGPQPAMARRRRHHEQALETNAALDAPVRANGAAGLPRSV